MECKKYYNYNVYEDGRIFSNYRNRFLKGDIVHGYLQYTIQIKGEAKRIKAHRLVAILFLNTPKNYNELVINHKDGNKLNNHFSNLEWCTTYYNNYHARINNLNNISKSNSKRWKNEEFRKRTSKNISIGLIKSGCNKNENNNRFRYEIYDKNGNKFNRSSLSKYLNLSQSYTDALIKRCANGISNQHFIDNGIYVIDIKNKVNRLSKTADNEKNITIASE